MKQMYTGQEIAAKLGTTSFWRLLDGAGEKAPGQFEGYKLFSVSEAFFAGHFPSHPIVPGVLHVEAMRQLVCFFQETVDRPLRLKSFNKVKFRRPIMPGDRVVFQAELISETPEDRTFKCSAGNAGGLCSEAMMTFKIGTLPPAPVASPIVWNDADRTDNCAMDTDRIMQLMPHRFPFLLIDYVTKIEGTKVTAVKNFTLNEPLFSQGWSTVPAALLCEVAAQSGCACVLSSPEHAGKLAFFLSIDKAEFFRPVYPGDQLVAEFDLPPIKSKFGKTSGVLKVGNEIAVDLSLMFAVVEA